MASLHGEISIAALPADVGSETFCEHGLLWLPRTSGLAARTSLLHATGSRTKQTMPFLAVLSAPLVVLIELGVSNQVLVGQKYYTYLVF